MRLAMTPVSHIADVMGGQAILGRRLGSLATLDDAVAQGLPKATLRQTVSRIFSGKIEQRRFMHRIVPEATFKRRRDRLSAAESERTERIATSDCECRVCVGRPRGRMSIPDHGASGAARQGSHRYRHDGAGRPAGGGASRQDLPWPPGIAEHLKALAAAGPSHRRQPSQDFRWRRRGAFGGRWNSPGRRVIYAAESYAGAMLEVLANSNIGRVPKHTLDRDFDRRRREH